ncbi:MAG: CPBP family intramembrane metalloprotease [Deltaproteobacteria bacterium]|nr:CPBP family intramembrane metalloprotease [Deltaproteobacteria bacterium]
MRIGVLIAMFGLLASGATRPARADDASGGERPVPARVSPAAAGALSLVPGLGQMITGRPLEGAAWLAAVVAGLSSRSTFFGQASFDLWQYNVYDAYRGAGARDVPDHGPLADYAAAFNPLNLWDPVSAGAVGVAFASHPFQRRYGELGYPSISKWLVPPFYAFVGMGEEGLFRGYLHPVLSDAFESLPLERFWARVAGATVSSAAFAAFHLVNGRALDGDFLVFGGRFLSGLAFCWQAERNDHDLRKNVFAHAWYDIILDYNARADKGVGLSITFR